MHKTLGHDKHNRQMRRRPNAGPARRADAAYGGGHATHPHEHTQWHTCGGAELRVSSTGAHGAMRIERTHNANDSAAGKIVGNPCNAHDIGFTPVSRRRGIGEHALVHALARKGDTGAGGLAPRAVRPRRHGIQHAGRMHGALNDVKSSCGKPPAWSAQASPGRLRWAYAGDSTSLSSIRRV